MTTQAPSDYPPHIEDLADAPFDHHDFNRRAFTIALWFVGHQDEDAFVEFINSRPLGDGYPRAHRLESAVRSVYASAGKKYDPSLASGGRMSVGEQLAELRSEVEKSLIDQVDKQVLLALVDHAIERGAYTVNASSRELANRIGIHYTTVATRLKQMSETNAYGVLVSSRWDGRFHHSRAWHLNLDYEAESSSSGSRALHIKYRSTLCVVLGDRYNDGTESVLRVVTPAPASRETIQKSAMLGKANTLKALAAIEGSGLLVRIDGPGRQVRYAPNLMSPMTALVSLPPEPKPQRLRDNRPKPTSEMFEDWAESLRMGTEVCARDVREALGVSSAQAKAWLARYVHIYFGGSSYPGDPTARDWSKRAAQYRKDEPLVEVVKMIENAEGQDVLVDQLARMWNVNPELVARHLQRPRSLGRYRDWWATIR